jgi:HD superfamily phosphohydrolase YqeK
MLLMTPPLCGGSTPAQVATLHDLYKICASSVSSNKARCKSTLEQIASSLPLHGSLSDPLTICVSAEGISDAKILEAVKRWHNLHEDRWNESAIDGVKQALHNSYPC